MKGKEWLWPIKALRLAKHSYGRILPQRSRSGTGICSVPCVCSVTHREAWRTGR